MALFQVPFHSGSLLQMGKHALLGAKHWWVGFPCSDHFSFVSGAALQEHQRAWGSTSFQFLYYYISCFIVACHVFKPLLESDCWAGQHLSVVTI